MIITRLSGGLGNQLFQYTIGKLLAEKHHTILKLDISLFSTYKLRKYELDNFKIEADIAGNDELNRIVDLQKIQSKKRKLKKIIGLLAGLYIKTIHEKHEFLYDPVITKAPDNICLTGYWQCEKYVSCIDDIIRNEFVLKEKITEKNASSEIRIKSAVNSVSLHIRRGDYVTDKTTNFRHGTCSMDYYMNCISILKKEFRDLTVFVFSDDIEWSKANLKINDSIYFINHNGPEHACEDLYLMSLCKHNIIANSSFSWWAAWLNQNKDKRVFAPSKWMNDSSIDTTDLIPSAWTRI
jgi:hypothetical protein